MTDPMHHHLHTRVLCLEDERCASRAVASRVGRGLRERLPEIDLIETTDWGVRLIDAVVGAYRLVVIDTECTGDAPAGSVRVIGGDEAAAAQPRPPHYVGLFEAIELGRYLGLAVAQEIVVVLVEVGEGGKVDTAADASVGDAIAAVVDQVQQIVM